MNLVVALPLPLRLVGLFVAGSALGAAVVWAADAVRLEPTFSSPWSRHPHAPRPRRRDFIPIFGWLIRNGQTQWHGPRFWIRPLLVELALGLCCTGLYWWEVERRALLGALPGAVPPGLDWQLHAAYFSHIGLVALMLVASLVDLDERIIPDVVTVPGTLLGLLLATVCPVALLPHVVLMGTGRVAVEFLTLASPAAWPAPLAGRWGLALGLACCWLAAAALLPRTWYVRHGWLRATGLLMARIRRERASYLLLALAATGSALVAFVWWRGGPSWHALLTALVGVAATGGIVWLVRIIGRVVLAREAMGFGDVTLMAMIGSFLGWQAGLMIFFIAPFFGLLLGGAQWVLHREGEIPYGPFLCLAALTVIVRWAEVWDWARDLFAIGWLVPAVALVSMALLGLLLGAWQLARRLLF